jgi:crotonobetainyl-CoA:carnitine CoA-transferase CaiB-like acyl-CoA transferase
MNDFSALAGLRVLDLATFIAAPFCAGLLAEFGAEVVKVEDPSAGDSLRRLGETYRGEPLWWLQESRNKLAITCNLRTERGQELIRRIAATADVVVENFRPGTLERWNLGYDRLAAENPALILVRVSAYGQTGPSASKAGFGRVAQAFGGLTYLTGFPDRPPALPGSATLADYAAGLFAAFATLVAKQHCDRTGQGQVIDVSLFESIFRLLDTLAIAHDTLGIVRERSGFEAPHAAPHSHYPTGDGKWVAIACTNDKIFARLCAAMERPELATDPRFLTVSSRVEHRDAIDEIVIEFTGSRIAGDLVEHLDRFEVPVSPIYSIADAVADPHYLAREALVEVDDDRVGTVRLPNVVPRLSRSPGSIRYLGRGLGADNELVYRDWLGLGFEELAGLRAEGVI